MSKKWFGEATSASPDAGAAEKGSSPEAEPVATEPLVEDPSSWQDDAALWARDGSGDDRTTLISPEGEVIELTPPGGGPAPPVEAPAVIAPPVAPPRPKALLERLQTHGPTQFGAALLLGTVVFGALQLTSEPEPEVAPAPVNARGFPKIDVEGFDKPFTHEDVRRLLARSAAREAAKNPPPPPPAEVVPSGLVRARPGELYDDSGQVGVVVGTPEDRARVLRREAVRARRKAAQTPAEAPRKRRVLGPEFFEPGGTLEVEETAPTQNRPSLDLEVGTVLEATLVMSVSSLAPGVVLARVTKSVQHQGRTSVRKGATLRGSARAERDRLFLTFHSLQQRGETFRFEGHATDKSTLGVAAVVHEASLESRGRSSAGRGAVGTAGSVIGELVGQSLPGRVARSVADGVASEAQEDLRPDRSRVLELPVGRSFQVVVAGGGA